jgi:Secretin and TonB N terminus short domain
VSAVGICVVDRGFGSRYASGCAACTGLQFRQASNSGREFDIPSHPLTPALQANSRAVRFHDRGWPAAVLAIAIVLAITTLATQSCSLAAEGNQRADEFPVVFNIPAQPLVAALEHFMEAAKVSVVVDSAVIAGRTSAPLRGHFSPEGALRSLLAGTGLDPRPIGSRAYTLDPLPDAGAVHTVPRFTNYAMAIQQAVTNALCQSDETRPTHYRVVMRLWLSPGGAVTHVQIGGSTGSRAPVPAGLPQPVKLAILPRVTPSDAACPPNDAGGQPAQNLSRRRAKGADSEAP